MSLSSSKEAISNTVWTTTKKHYISSFQGLQFWLQSFLKFVWNKKTLLLISFSCCFVVYHKILLTFSLRWITSQVFKSIYKTVAVAEWIRHWLWNPAVRVQTPVREKSFLQRKLEKSEQDLWYTKKKTKRKVEIIIKQILIKGSISHEPALSSN